MSIPIIIHLLHRQKTTPLMWGAMMFLKESPLQMKRRKDIDYWLLMLLRMAALALVAWLLPGRYLITASTTRSPPISLPTLPLFSIIRCRWAATPANILSLKKPRVSLID